MESMKAYFYFVVFLQLNLTNREVIYVCNCNLPVFSEESQYKQPLRRTTLYVPFILIIKMLEFSYEAQ